MTRYFEDPSGVSKVIHYEVSEEDLQAQRRDYAARVSEEVDSILDWAVGTGRIEMAERDQWSPKLYADPDWGRRTLELLTPHEEAAERAFAQDPRIRSLDHQWAEHNGIERTVTYEADDDATQEEQMAREFLSVLGR